MIVTLPQRSLAAVRLLALQIPLPQRSLENIAHECLITVAAIDSKIIRIESVDIKIDDAAPRLRLEDVGLAEEVWTGNVGVPILVLEVADVYDCVQDSVPELQALRD